MSNQSKAAGQDTAKVVIERTYRARIEDVWDLWTTRAGFESWWGPEGFRAAVHEIEARVGGVLRYAMIAESPEMIAAMKEMGTPDRHVVRSTFTELRPREHLVLSSVIDFLPGVAAYESDLSVDLATVGDRVRMVVTLHGMHDAEFTRMQEQGFTSQLTKLDRRFGER